MFDTSRLNTYYELLHKTASTENTDHCFILASLYENGMHEFQADQNCAFRLYRMSAKAGNKEAIERVMKMYVFGRGISRDAMKASHYWKKLQNIERERNQKMISKKKEREGAKKRIRQELGLEIDVIDLTEQ